MKDNHHPSNDIILQRLAERDPAKFLSLYPDPDSGSANPGERMRLRFLRAKAMAVQGKWQDVEPLVLDILATAVELADQSMIAACNLLLADAYQNTGRQERCLPSLNIALETARSAKDTSMIAKCLSRLARYHLTRHDRATSLKYYARAIRTADEANDPELKLSILFVAAATCLENTDLPRALELYAEALTTARAIDDTYGIFQAIDRLAATYMEMRRLEEAEAILLQGLAMAEGPAVPLSVARLHFSLGCVLMAKGSFRVAIDSYHKCRAITDSVGFNDPRYLDELYNNLAGCHRYLDENDTAIAYLEEAERVALNTRNVRSSKETALNKANILIGMGRLQEAKAILLDVSRYFARNKMHHMLRLARANLADLYDISGDHRRAIATLKELVELHRQEIDRINSAKARELDVRINDLLQQNEQIRQTTISITDRYRNAIAAGFVGSSPQIRKVLETALAAAHHPGASVLITGESGTGKEVVANLIHMNCIRSGFPFVAVNVSAISSGLLESEFFGHRKGSFTNAISDHTGYFEQAHRGTLYLDEIADMPLELQSKLLRVLETREVVPVGDTKPRSFDCRVISSTNRDIARMIGRDSFRLDLYHRLNTIEIHIPPLRERPEDIPALVAHYVPLIANELKVDVPLVEDSFVDRLRQYQFPGNVRELRNILERLLIMLAEKRWDAATLNATPSVQTKRGFKAPGGHITRVKDMLQNEIIRALQASGGKQKDAARILGMSEPTLTRRIKALHLEAYTRKGS